MLEVAIKTTIKTLYEQGHSKAHIARLLGIDRKTVRKVLRDYDAGVPPEQKKSYRALLRAFLSFLKD